LFLGYGLFQWRVRGNPLWSAVEMVLEIGVIVFVAATVIEVIRQVLREPRRWRDPLIALGVGLAPFVAYCIYLWNARGTPMQFFIDQRDGWGRMFVGPVESFLATWNTRTGLTYPTNWIFAWRIEIIAAFAGVLLSVWALVRREYGYAAYMAIFMVALVTSTWYFSIPRMLVSFFPAILMMARATHGRPERHELALVVLAPVATLGVVVFTRGAWFY
jgi:hypothetical protein